MFCASVDLPTPFGPTRTTLVASARKSSAISASTAARSQRLAQFQSKSQSGLKRPIWAVFSRRSRLRQARCVSSHSSSGATQASVATSGQCDTKPYKCSASARLRMVSSSVIGTLLQLVIGFECVWLHRRVTCLHMGGQHDGDLWRVTALFAPAFESESHGVRMRHIALQRLEDGELQIGGAGAIEQPHQRGGDGAEIGAAFGSADEQGLAGGSHLCEAVRSAVLASGALLLDQLLDVGGDLDLRALVVAALVAGEHLGTVDDAHLVWIGENGQCASHMIMGNRVIVQVEADIGRLADRDGDALEQ